MSESMPHMQDIRGFVQAERDINEASMALDELKVQRQQLKGPFSDPRASDRDIAEASQRLAVNKDQIKGRLIFITECKKQYQELKAIGIGPFLGSDERERFYQTDVTMTRIINEWQAWITW